MLHKPKGSESSKFRVGTVNLWKGAAQCKFQVTHVVVKVFTLTHFNNQHCRSNIWLDGQNF